MSGIDSEDEAPLLERIQEDPNPAVRWLVGALALFALEAGAVVHFVTDLLGSPVTIPTLLSRSLIPNIGYQNPETGEWVGTFLGLEPAYAWAFRVVLVYVYAFVVMWWLWRGYLVFREHYRYADWTPRDDMIDRLRTHRWGQFGAIIVFAFVVMAVFAPALGPTTVERTISNPYSYNIQYYEGGTLQEITVGQANLGSRSQGTPDRNVGPMQYDEFGRFHPFGTLPSGKDMFTFMTAGARVSLFIGLVSIGLSGFIAASFALLTAYYKGLIDLVVVITGDSIMSLPRLLFVMLLTVVLGESWISSVYNGGFLLALIFAGTGWPFLWRAVRGPAFQVAEQEWIDAAKSFGQKPRVTMQKHMAPYILGYLLVYASMSLGGIIVAVAGLSFLGLGINPPTPEWGRAIDIGQSYVTTSSWHISFIPGVMIVLVVTAFNALGDGIRDAIDPQSEGGEGEGAEVAAASGGGA